jgi:hypothetical protein
MSTEHRLLPFLSDTLDLWRVAGTVEAGESPVVAVIRTEGGAVVTIERYAVHPSTSPRYAPDERSKQPPFRWIVRTERPRPCASLVGLLNALRAALGVERGSAVRVAPAPAEP